VSKMTRTELIIQLLKIAIGLAFGAYFVWWSLEVLDRLAPENEAPTPAVGHIVKVHATPVERGPHADTRLCRDARVLRFASVEGSRQHHKLTVSFHLNGHVVALVSTISMWRIRSPMTSIRLKSASVISTAAK
jgi:hypothetical protein